MKTTVFASRKRFALFLVFTALLVILCMATTALANTGSTPVKDDSAAFLQMLSDAKANQQPGGASLSPSIARGYYNTGTDVNYISHTSYGTYTYKIGSQIYVEALFKNADLKPNIECYFGIYDYDKGEYGEYIDAFYLGNIETAQEAGSMYIDTSGLAISSDRYSIDAFIYDANADIDDFDVYDEFALNIKAISTPAITSATSSGVHSVKLSWTSQTNVTGYTVYKATSSAGPYSYVGKSSSTSYNCTGLTTGKSYYFKVKAYCSGGAIAKYSGYSAYKVGKPMPPTPAPTAISASYTSNKISWQAVEGASGYQIYRSTSATGTYSLLKTVGLSTYSYTNTGLVTGKTYYYKVRAYHTEITGTKYYSSFSAYKAAKPVPSTPSVTLALTTNNTGIKVSWKAIVGASGYQIYRSTSASGTYSYMGTAASTATSWTNTSLPAGQVYYYKVRAYHVESGVKIYGNYCSAKYHDTLGVPVVTANPQPDGASTIIIWNNTKMYQSDYGFEVYRVNADSSLTLLNGSDFSISRFADVGLQQFTSYTYKVRGFHLEGSVKIYGPFSALATTTTSVVLTEPVLVMDGLVQDTSGTSPIPGAQIHWSAVENAAGYVIEKDDLATDSDFNKLTTVAADTTTFTDWDINATTGMYYYRVYAYYGTLGTSDYVHGDYSNNVHFYASSYQ